MDQIGVTGKARYWGIPDATITYAGRSGTTHTLSLFTRVDKDADADVDKSNDNGGELQAMNRRNLQLKMSFSAKPIGAANSNALAIGADLPKKNATCTIVCATDADIACDGTADTILIDSAKASYSPEGELAIEFSVTKWIGKVFIALS